MGLQQLPVGMLVRTSVDSMPALFAAAISGKLSRDRGEILTIAHHVLARIHRWRPVDVILPVGDAGQPASGSQAFERVPCKGRLTA
jgi:hypothetical protein